MNLIRAVLNDEQRIALKDLPSAYAVSHSLIYKLQKMQTLKSNTKFEEMVDASLQSEVDTQLFERLSSMDGASNNSRSISLVARAFRHMESLKTADIIRAMFIMPLEVRR